MRLSPQTPPQAQPRRCHSSPVECPTLWLDLHPLWLVPLRERAIPAAPSGEQVDRFVAALSSHAASLNARFNGALTTPRCIHRALPCNPQEAGVPGLAERRATAIADAVVQRSVAPERVTACVVSSRGPLPTQVHTLPRHTLSIHLHPIDTPTIHTRSIHTPCVVSLRGPVLTQVRSSPCTPFPSAPSTPASIPPAVAVAVTTLPHYPPPRVKRYNASAPICFGPLTLHPPLPPAHPRHPRRLRRARGSLRIGPFAATPSFSRPTARAEHQRGRQRAGACFSILVYRAFVY